MSQCSCIKGHFDFLIEPLDVKKFRYVDLSDWMEDDSYVIPSTFPVEVTLPNKRVVIIHVKPKSSTIINSVDLGIGCLEDGSYCFTADSCGRKYSKTVSILSRIRCRVNNIIATEDSDKGLELNAKLKQIEVISQTGQVKKAADLYDLLNKEVKRYNCNTCDC